MKVFEIHMVHTMPVDRKGKEKLEQFSIVSYRRDICFPRRSRIAVQCLWDDILYSLWLYSSCKEDIYKGNGFSAVVPLILSLDSGFQLYFTGLDLSEIFLHFIFLHIT